MKKARITTGLVLLILLASLIQWPQATAITPQDQTISITDTHDDLFITETGIGIDSQLCHITDPTMDIRSFLVFRELEINFWEPLKNATLRFRTTATLDFDVDSSVTVYGMRYSDLQREGWLNPGWVLSVPLTDASVNVNTSQFYGQTWHEVNVTAIVEELIRSYDWDGDGADGTETGDAIGFIILGAEGYDTRWFIDYLYGTPSLAPQLVIHWNHEPPPPSGYPTAEFNETYRGYNIWNHTEDIGFGNHSDYDLDWSTLNFTELTEYDSGSAIFLRNDTWVEAIGLDHAYQCKFENDTGAGNINSAIFLYHLNVTNVEAQGAPGYVYPCGIFGVQTVGGMGAGYPYMTDGDGIWLMIGIHVDDDGRWRLVWRERDGAGNAWPGGGSGWIYEATPESEVWGFAKIDQTSNTVYNALYNDSRMTYLNKTYSATHTLTMADGNYRYGQACFSSAQGVGYGNGWFDLYSLLDIPEGKVQWIVTDENGTTVDDDLDTYEDAILVIEDELGADPEDPDPPGEEWTEGPGGETGAFTRFRMRLWFMIIGFGCVFGPVLFFAWRRPSGYYMGAGFILMLIGLGLLLSIGQV